MIFSAHYMKGGFEFSTQNLPRLFRIVFINVTWNLEEIYKWSEHGCLTNCWERDAMFS